MRGDMGSAHDAEDAGVVGRVSRRRNPPFAGMPIRGNGNPPAWRVTPAANPPYARPTDGFPHRLGKSLWTTTHGQRATRQITRFPLDCTRTRHCHEFAIILL